MRTCFLSPLQRKTCRDPAVHIWIKKQFLNGVQWRNSTYRRSSVWSYLRASSRRCVCGGFIPSTHTFMLKGIKDASLPHIQAIYRFSVGVLFDLYKRFNSMKTCSVQFWTMCAYGVSLNMLAVAPLTSQQLFLVPLQMVVLVLLNPAPPPAETEGLGTCCPLCLSDLTSV